MGFKLVKCPNGHYFDSSQFNMCPQCGAAVTAKQIISTIEHTQPWIDPNLGKNGGKSSETPDPLEPTNMSPMSSGEKVDNPFKYKIDNPEKPAPKPAPKPVENPDGMISGAVKDISENLPPQKAKEYAAPQELVHQEQPVKVEDSQQDAVHRWPPESQVKVVNPNPVNPAPQPVQYSQSQMHFEAAAQNQAEPIARSVQYPQSQTHFEAAAQNQAEPIVGSSQLRPQEQHVEAVTPDPVNPIEELSQRRPQEQRDEAVAPDPVNPIDELSQRRSQEQRVEAIEPSSVNPISKQMDKWSPEQRVEADNIRLTIPPPSPEQHVENVPPKQVILGGMPGNIPPQVQQGRDNRPMQGNPPPQVQPGRDNRPGQGVQAYPGRNDPYYGNYPNDPYYGNPNPGGGRGYINDSGYGSRGGYPNDPYSSQYTPSHNQPIGGVSNVSPSVSSLNNDLRQKAQTLAHGRRVVSPHMESLYEDDERTVALDINTPERVLPVGFLIVLNGSRMGKVFTLYSGENRIGRNGKGHRFEIDLSFNNKIHRALQASVIYTPQNRMFSILPNRDGEERMNRIAVNGYPLDRHIILDNYSRIMVESTVMMFVAVCGNAFDWENM